ncbi:hypothetical protein HLB23_39735 [Nocardia uniformis]|uniref:Uncharacterized protein n=1 Tax=Nocardia uniformis TaxID=53432 RepID=A0A849CI76_9NOCA|nr:hypothetical protein [Nocardia uniformis]NNH75919.1 hypothetical protein [Nocardia uniformis]
MKLTLRIAILMAAVSACGTLGMQAASATPPIPTPEPGGVIRLDIAPGEWWSCNAASLQPPFYQVSPGIYQYSLGPNPIYMRFTPGADVWTTCHGTGAPFIYYGPIVKAGW